MRGFRHQERRLLVRRRRRYLLVGESGIDLEEVASRVAQPEFVPRRAAPGRARDADDFRARRPRPLVASITAAWSRHAKPQVIEAVQCRQARPCR